MGTNKLSSGEVFQYMTDAFIRNNRAALNNIIEDIIRKHSYQIDEEGKQDVIDKAVFSFMRDMCSKKIMESQDTVLYMISHKIEEFIA